MPEPHPTVNLLESFATALSERDASPRTIQAYKHDIAQFMNYLAKLNSHVPDDLRVVTPDLVQDFFHTKVATGSTLSSMKRALCALREFFDQLVKENQVAINPCAGLSVKSISRNLLSLNDTLRIFDYLRQHQASPLQLVATRYRRDELIALFMIILGLRQYHIPNLTIEALQRKGSSFVVSATESAAVEVPVVILTRLRGYLAPRTPQSEFLFTDPQTGLPIDTDTIRALRKELAHALNVDCSTTAMYQTSIHLKEHPDDMQRLFKALERPHPELLCSQSDAMLSNAHRA